VVLRKKSRRDRLEPALVIDIGENGFRHDPISVRKVADEAELFSLAAAPARGGSFEQRLRGGP